MDFRDWLLYILLAITFIAGIGNAITSRKEIKEKYKQNPKKYIRTMVIVTVISIVVMSALGMVILMV